MLYKPGQMCSRYDKKNKTKNLCIHKVDILMREIDSKQIHKIHTILNGDIAMEKL